MKSMQKIVVIFTDYLKDEDFDFAAQLFDKVDMKGFFQRCVNGALGFNSVLLFDSVFFILHSKKVSLSLPTIDLRNSK